MAVRIPWAGILLAGDYLSPIEIPTMDHGGGAEDYLGTLTLLRDAVAGVEVVVPGHGPTIDAVQALRIADEDQRYLRGLLQDGDAELPDGRRSAEQQRLHARNVATLG